MGSSIRKDKEVPKTLAYPYVSITRRGRQTRGAQQKRVGDIQFMLEIINPFSREPVDPSIKYQAEESWVCQ